MIIPSHLTMDQMTAAYEQLLRNTLSVDKAVRTRAERDLEALRERPGCGRVLLELASSTRAGFGAELRLAAAVTFKNYVKVNWPEEPSVALDESERAVIRTHIVQQMMHTDEPGVQRQLADAISLIAAQDFPTRWPELMPQLTERFTSQYAADAQWINRSLSTASALCRRYRHESRSNDLWTEILYVLQQLAAPLTELFVRRVEAARNDAQLLDANMAQNGLTVNDCWTSIELCTQLFYSLTSQDLPEFFEDNMQVWMNAFLQLYSRKRTLLQLLNMEPARLKTSDDDECGGIIESVRSQICDVVAMFAQKYDEEFAAYLPAFVERVWTLLVSTGCRPKYDALMSNAIQFLASVASRQQYKQLFAAPGALAQICERVIVPNMQLRDADVETFEDNPDEFMLKDLEGNDTDTRRRSAADFVRSLCTHFETEVIDIFRTYLQQMLVAYAGDAANQWRQKEVGIFLVIALAARGHTARMGATSTSQLIDVNDFYLSHVQPELMRQPINAMPVLKAASLKYLITFRSQLPPATIVTALSVCIEHLQCESIVVRSYAAHCIERMMLLKDGQTRQLLLFTALQPHATSLLTGLFTLLRTPGTQLSDNGIKCVMRTISTLKSAVLPFTEHIINELSEKLIEVAKNPSRPQFNHYLFECYCVLIKVVNEAASTTSTDDSVIVKFESALFPPFQLILQQDVQEFLPYVFQILSMMLDMRPVATGLPGPYAQLLPFILLPELWERAGAVRSLVDLLRAYLRLAGGVARQLDATQLSGILGIFQKLVATRQNDVHGFALLNAVMQYIDWVDLQPNARGIWVILFNRLQSATKTARYVHGVLVAMCVFIVRYGASTFVTQLESVQAGMFSMVLEKVICREAATKLNDSDGDRKLAAVAFVRLLVDATQACTCDGNRPDLWRALLQCCVQLLAANKNAVAATAGGNVDDDDDDERTALVGGEGYTTVHATLAHASGANAGGGGVSAALTSDVSDARALLAKELETLGASAPQLMPQLMTGLDADVQTFIQQTPATAHAQHT